MVTKNKLVHWFVILIFTLLYFCTSVISTIHVVDFFELTNPFALSVSLAIAFELGAAASLASLVILDKINRPLIWVLFITLTLFQSMGNMFYSYQYAHGFTGWVEMFGLSNETVIFQKRILAAVSGAILPLVALGYIKSLVDYISPRKEKKEKYDVIDDLFEKKKIIPEITQVVQEKSNEEILPPATLIAQEENKAETASVAKEAKPEHVIPIKHGVPEETIKPEVKKEINNKKETVFSFDHLSGKAKKLAEDLHLLANGNKKVPQGDEFLEKK